MAKRALYRQYRSKSFDEVVGQEHITDLLREAVKRGSISHAYLFTGPRGTGKTSVARILAHEINGVPYSEEVNLDIIEIDAASNRRIDDIRDLREKVHIAPLNGRFKVYIIDEVHMLTGESFNALLKTLEEPPAHAIFILATTELHKVPATIVSRTQRFAFRPIAQEKVVTHLKAIAAKENILIDDAALELVALHGGGSFRDSISLLDQLASGQAGTTTITASTVEQVLGVAPGDALRAIIEAIKTRDQMTVITQLEGLYKNGYSAVTIADQLLKLLPVAALDDSRLYTVLETLIEVPRSYAPQLKLLALLAHAAENPKPAKSMPLSAVTPPVVNAPLTAVKKAVKSSPPRATVSEITPPEPVIASLDEPLEKGEFDWNRVLTLLQKHNAPLHSVLKRATATNDGTSLTLSFAYNLHRKKMEDGKYRSMLTGLITDMYGSCPELKVILGSAQPPSDPTAASVAAIMGGGEQVHA